MLKRLQEIELDLTRGVRIVICGVVMVLAAKAQQKRIYIAPDDHTDYVWSGTEEQYRKVIPEMTNYYLDLTDRTMNRPADLQSRWNFDGSLWMWLWEQTADKPQIERLVSRLKDGHFSMPLNFAVSTYGGVPTEAVLRSMYYSGDVQRRFGLKLDIAIAMENQTLPRGLGSLWAGSGARYSWKGVCACASLIRPVIIQQRPQEIYWWKGPDDSRILMKWNSLFPSGPSTGRSIGGYGEGHEPAGAVLYASDSPAFRKAYPYDAIGIFGEGWDDLKTTNDSFINAAAKLTTPQRRVIVSNEEDFFRDFESHYGKQIPTVTAGYGNEWDLYAASLAAVTSRVREATELLRPAEAMASIVSLHDPSFYGRRKEQRNAAWAAFGLYYEHDWTADSHVLKREEREDFQRRTEAAITGYTQTLLKDSTEALGSKIARHGERPRYFVFNALNWERDDFADLPYSGSSDVHVVDLSNGATVPSQVVKLQEADGKTASRLRIWATKIPSVGYKTFEVVPGVKVATGVSPKAAGDVLDNERYRVQVAGNGSLISVIDKKLNNRELVRKIGDKAANDFGPGEGSLAVVNSGPVSATIEATVKGPLPRRTAITLYRNSDRIDIRNELLGNFADVRTWSYGFNIDAPRATHEEIGAINDARLEPEGSYAAKFSRLDWLSLNHFAAMTGSDGAGVTLSNADCSFMKLGSSSVVNSISQLDTKTPQISVLAGGQVDGPKYGILKQGGDTYFLQRFALQGYARYSPAASMRFALEHQNGLIAGAITGSTPGVLPEKEYSLLSTTDPNLMLWALKPAEENGPAGLVARFWNISDGNADATVAFTGGLASASALTHLETEPQPVEVKAGTLKATARQWQLRSWLLQPNAGRR